MFLRRTPILPALVLLVVLVTACGGSSDSDSSAGEGSTTSEAGGDTSSSSSTTTGSSRAAGAAEIIGEDTAFAAGGGGAADVSADVADRECELDEVLFGSCRASTGAGGPFLVTAEGDPDDFGDWNVVARCGLDPAAPVASAKGTFQPATADLGLAPYGDVLGVSLSGADEAEGALVYQPEGADCPVVWGLGPIEPYTIFLGGTDALNGEERPIQFTAADGSTACATADGDGGITVSAASGDGCV